MQKYFDQEKKSAFCPQTTLRDTTFNLLHRCRFANCKIKWNLLKSLEHQCTIAYHHYWYNNITNTIATITIITIVTTITNTITIIIIKVKKWNLLKSLQRRITASDPDANLRVSARPCTPRLTIIVIESPKHQKEVKIINLRVSARPCVPQ